MAYKIEPMSLGQVLDNSFRVLRDNFKLLFGIAAYLYIPMLLVLTFLNILLIPGLPKNVTPQEAFAYQLHTGSATAILGIVQFVLLFAIVQPLTFAAATYAISRVYLGEPTTPGQAFRAAIRIVGRVLGTGALVFLFIVGGLILFIIPGIILIFSYYLSSEVVVIEGLAGMPALRRSKLLMKGNKSTAFVLNLLLGILVGLLGSVGKLVPTVLGASIATIVLQAAGVMLTVTVGVVYYYQCRARVEHFDLQQLADAVAVPYATPPPPPSYAPEPPPLPDSPL